MKSSSKTFYEKCLSGEISESEIEKSFHRHVKSWRNHENPGAFLFEFLGMSQNLFEAVDNNPKVLLEIVRFKDNKKTTGKNREKIEEFIKNSFVTNEDGDLSRAISYPSVKGPVINKISKEDLLDLCDFVYQLNLKGKKG